MSTASEETAVIIGAGPAGLTAAYELLTRSSIIPVVVEMTDMLGGIARTVEYKGNRIDIGGHRFFTKSDRVLKWWLDMLPLQKLNGQADLVAHLPGLEGAASVDPETTDKVMLVRSRKSRIYHRRKFFDYPLTLNCTTIRNLGLRQAGRIGASYLRSRAFPIRPEETLEEFLINRFGQELYRTFFESYTEKVWGVPCREISAAWGVQRIKGLSIGRAIWHAVSKPFRTRDNVSQKNTETSLIERFLYPKLGPGQLWEVCGRKIQQLGGRILTNVRVDRILTDEQRVVGVVGLDRATSEEVVLNADHFFSTMAVKDLVRALDCHVPDNTLEISEGLPYRDFVTIGLLLSELEIREENGTQNKCPDDNWIYIQEPEVGLGRLQIFNNWSPGMVADPSTVWIGLEYFCNEGDDLWTQSDPELVKFAAEELARIGMIDRSKVLDSTVIRTPKAYPAYFGTYDRFGELREYLDRFENLYLIGRNGMHRYNNMDHSMLTAMTAVDNILRGRKDKANIWEQNNEQAYHESK